jgi:YD repeat-containing protein
MAHAWPHTKGTVTYSYDTNDQLLGADRAGTSGDETYSYDRNGNRTLSGYTTGANNRVSAAPGFTYTYDDEGNLATKTEAATGKVTTYAYDHRNRLTSVTTKDTGGVTVASATFKYDALERRIRTLIASNGGWPCFRSGNRRRRADPCDPHARTGGFK